MYWWRLWSVKSVLLLIAPDNSTVIQFLLSCDFFPWYSWVLCISHSNRKRHSRFSWKLLYFHFAPFVLPKEIGIHHLTAILLLSYFSLNHCKWFDGRSIISDWTNRIHFYSKMKYIFEFCGLTLRLKTLFYIILNLRVIFGKCAQRA